MSQTKMWMRTRSLVPLLALACACGSPHQRTGWIAEVPESISRDVVQGGPNPAAQTFTITNNGAASSCPLAVNVSASTQSGSAWLSVSPASGTLNGGTSLTISVTFDVVGPALTPATYTGTLTITGSCTLSGVAASGSPVLVPVNLTVTPPPAPVLGVGTTAVGQDVATLVNTWGAQTNTNVAPSARANHAAVWTGYKMIIWGGTNGDSTGGVYVPGNDTWTPTSQVNAPAGRSGPSAAWTGSKMLVWGGGGTNTGGLYDPSADVWTAITTTGAPSARSGQTGVWTGSKFIVWGGSAAGTATNTGGIYDPVANSWSATSTANAPSARSKHTAVWTGSRMIIFGGDNGDSTGGVYDPVANLWTPTSLVNAPAARINASAVWTGSRMLVWGGAANGLSLSNGGLYDPLNSAWSATSITSAPSAEYASAIWTGSRLVVFGGDNAVVNGTSPSNAGGIFDPVGNAWIATSAAGAPAARSQASAVWTGTQMLVWGGLTVFPPVGSANPPSYTNSGQLFQ